VTGAGMAVAYELGRVGFKNGRYLFAMASVIHWKVAMSDRTVHLMSLLQAMHGGMTFGVK
jgi:hypothetical protein